MVALLILVYALVVCGKTLSDADEAMLRSMRYDYVDEVGGFEAGHGQPHSMLLTLLDNDRRALCKNGRLSYYKMEQLVNEVFAFYLDRLLHVGHVPPATITEFSGRRFKDVRDRPVVKDYWRRGDPMVCSAYADDVGPAVWPAVFRNQKVQLNVPYGESRWSDEEKRQVELWSGVLLLDFLTGNYDRLPVSLNQSAAGFSPRVKRKQNTPISLAQCGRPNCHVQNAFVDEAGNLILVDNNAGFFYDRAPSLEALTWLLEDTCVFPHALLEQFAKYQDGADFRKALNVFVMQHEPEGPMQNNLRSKVFMIRFDAMMRHIQNCRALYKGKVSFP